MHNLEPIYDKKIAPLMTQIIQICNEHDIPLVFSCQLTDQEYEDTRTDGAEEEDGPLFCTTALLPEWCSEKLGQAKDILYTPASATTLTLTARDAEGTATAIERILFQP